MKRIAFLLFVVPAFVLAGTITHVTEFSRNGLSFDKAEAANTWYEKAGYYTLGGAQMVVDKAAKHHVIHPNKASNLKSKTAKALAGIA